MPNSVMMHDFAITETDAVFWDLPVVFDLELATQFIEDPRSGAFPYQWRPEAGARVGVMPLAGGADRRCGGSTSSRATCSTASTRSVAATRSSSTCAGCPMFVEGEVLGGDARCGAGR